MKWTGELLSFVSCQVADIVKIQSFWRAKKAKQDYKQLGELSLNDARHSS